MLNNAEFDPSTGDRGRGGRRAEDRDDKTIMKRPLSSLRICRGSRRCWS